MNVTRNQWLQILAVVMGASIAASSMWTQLFGQATATVIVSLLGFGNTILAGVTYVLTGQGQQVKDVLAMDGVQKIDVNARANQTLAAIAVDPTVDKIAPLPAAVSTVEATAKGA